MNGKYSPETRECVFRMLDEAKPEYPNLISVMGRVSSLLGMSAEALRVWYRRCGVDAG